MVSTPAGRWRQQSTGPECRYRTGTFDSRLTWESPSGVYTRVMASRARFGARSRRSELLALILGVASGLVMLLAAAEIRSRPEWAGKLALDEAARELAGAVENEWAEMLSSAEFGARAQPTSGGPSWMTIRSSAPQEHRVVWGAEVDAKRLEQVRVAIAAPEPGTPDDPDAIAAFDALLTEAPRRISVSWGRDRSGPTRPGPGPDGRQRSVDSSSAPERAPSPGSRIDSRPRAASSVPPLTPPRRLVLVERPFETPTFAEPTHRSGKQRDPQHRTRELGNTSWNACPRSGC